MQLSNECRDLLDRIFDADVKKRITVDGIMQHPWYMQPLPPQYQSQLQHLEQVQAEREAHISSRQIDPVCLPPPLTDVIRDKVEDMWRTCLMLRICHAHKSFHHPKIACVGATANVRMHEIPWSKIAE